MNVLDDNQQTTPIEKNNSKITNAWCSYDGANSVYNLIITTAIFPIYYAATTREFFNGDMVSFFGMSIKNSVLYTYAISFSFMVIAILSPLLSGVADYSGKKKGFMQFFTYMGALACIGLYFFDGSNIEYGIFCAVIASIGYAGSLVFYNAFLPEIATSDRMDKVSARGFSMGYLASVLVLVVCLILIMKFETFGLSDASQASKISFLIVGFWWIGFSQIAFYFLKDKPVKHKITAEVFTKGFSELKVVFNHLKSQNTTLRFLVSFFIYSMGVQTIIYLASLFAESEVKMSSEKMILVIIIIQITAILGAVFFAFLSDKKGNKFSIIATLVIWIFVSFAAYILTDANQFFMLAAVLGLAMGGIQSMSRSTYSKLIPSDSPDTASYFSFYDVTEKLAIVVGTFSYGFIEQLTGSVRNSILAMSIFFILGLIVLLTAKIKKTNS